MGRHRIPKAAADLLRRGFHIFPIIAGTKDRIPVAWGSEATDDPARVAAWALEFRGCNWGVACGPSGLAVVDVDVHDGSPGPETLAALELAHGGLPPTLEARTPSGGRHLFFRGRCRSVAHLMRDRAGFGPKTGLDTRSTGGYVVGAGSRTPVGEYAWSADAPVAALPAWVAEAAGAGRERAEGEGRAVISEDAEADLDRARRYLAKAPPSVEGEGGDDNAYRIACALREMGLSEDTAFELMLDHWNDRCEPPWGAGQLRVKVLNAWRYAQSDQGASSAEADFADEPPEAPGQTAAAGADTGAVVPELPAVVAELNAKHSKVMMGGCVVVFNKERTEAGHLEWVPIKRTEFDALYEYRRVETPDGRTVKLGPFWREHPGHMRSSGVVMDPALPPGPNGCGGPFNLWSGWSVEPRRAPWPNIGRVVDEALCAGNRVLSRYVLDWLAYLFQHPAEPAKVALVFRGAKGTGKSTLTTILLRILGPHAMQASDIEEVTGRFNWHLRNKVLIVAEEAKWLGDRGAEGTLKSLITDPVKSYEAKGLARVQGRNCASLILNSNEEWVVPASMQDERRFVVQDVDEGFRGDHAFWDRVYDEVWGDGCAGMLHDLLRRPLGGFRPWVDAPKTEALAAQVMESLDFMGQWWLDVLTAGEVPNMAVVKEDADWEKAPVEVRRGLMHESYALSVRRGYRAKDVRMLGKFLKRLGVRTGQISKGDDRGKKTWVLPQLDEARRLFSEQAGTDLFSDGDDMLG
jgi:hypothetical protein